MTYLVSLDESVVLVGNGPSATAKLDGDLIDSFGCVVRFNLFEREGYERFVGLRTDIWVINGNAQVHRHPVRAVSIKRGVVVANPHVFGQGVDGDPYFHVSSRRQEAIQCAKNLCCKTRGRLAFDIVPDELWHSVAIRMQQLAKTKRIGRPSTGAIMAEWLGTTDRPVHLTGFDCFTGGVKEHHYFPSTMQPGHHREQWESLFINSLIDEGRAVML